MELQLYKDITHMFSKLVPQIWLQFEMLTHDAGNYKWRVSALAYNTLFDRYVAGNIQHYVVTIQNFVNKMPDATPVSILENTWASMGSQVSWKQELYVGCYQCLLEIGLFYDAVSGAPWWDQGASLPMCAGSSCAYLDIYQFKLYNQKHGFLAANTQLQKLGEWLKNTKAYRLGGDSFVVFFSNPTDLAVFMEETMKTVPISVWVGIYIFATPGEANIAAPEMEMGINEASKQLKLYECASFK
jgi:Diguanylate cyclase, GGDEF domain